MMLVQRRFFVGDVFFGRFSAIVWSETRANSRELVGHGYKCIKVGGNMTTRREACRRRRTSRTDSWVLLPLPYFHRTPRGTVELHEAGQCRILALSHTASTPTTHTAKATSKRRQKNQHLRVPAESELQPALFDADAITSDCEEADKQEHTTYHNHKHYYSTLLSECLFVVNTIQYLRPKKNV